jgi:microcin C transport system substrate-binding protein
MRFWGGIAASFWVLCAASAWAQQPATTQWKHALTLFGTPKYAADFAHFDYVNPDAPKGGRFSMAYMAVFDSLNPYILKGVSAPAMHLVHMSLMTPSADEPRSYYPAIAEAVRLGPERRYVDFRLNPKARFHDGSPVRVADVLFSFHALKQEGHPVYRLHYKGVKKAEKLGPRVVRFHFMENSSRELPLIMAGMPVLSEAYFTDVPFGKTSLEPPLGNGPYRVAAVDAGRSIRFERVKGWWGARLPSSIGQHNFDTLYFDVFRDDVVALEAIKSGQIDFHQEYIARNFATAYDIPAVARGELLKLAIPHKIPRGMQAFMFNQRRSKFADPRTREAVALTMDFAWMNKTLFYNAYTRSESFFGATPFEATGVPEGEELALLEPYRDRLPPALFSEAFAMPTTDGSGFARDNLIRAQSLLNEAGWVMKDGKRVHAQTGEVFTVEFLMRQRTFERVVAIMRKNLAKLGIDSTFRYVDDSQYQKRVDARDFDMISIWWNSGLHYPGAEQYAFWHSSQAETKGSNNLGGLQNAVVDDLVERVARAQDLETLTPAARALDRVLSWQYVVIPHWHLNRWRLVHWDRFGKPDIFPAYDIGTSSWWAKEAEKETTP